jgi:hypothetical protein
VRAPSFYKSKITQWEAWLDANTSAKASHRRSAEHLLAAYLSVLPEAEAVFGRLRAVEPRPETPCEAPGCTKTFPWRANRRSCSAACRRALSRRGQRAAVPGKARQSAPARRQGRPNAGMVGRHGEPESVTPEPRSRTGHSRTAEPAR